MEFGFTEEQEKLRKEVHDFYSNELPEDYAAHTPAMNEELQSFWQELQKKAGEKGYLTPGWSKELGGLGLSDIEQGIVMEEEGYARVVWPNFVGLHQLAPPIVLFGTEEQKKKFLPEISEGTVVWFQAWTEPEAGSDEANQQTWAIEDGDDYVINGQKVFITGQYKPDYLFTECRTADTVPKHRGISLFLVPGDTPGITYRPLPTMGFGTQNEIFFDDVRVPKKNLLGELNRGFYHVMAAFEFERSGTGGTGGAKRTLEELVQFCRETERNGKPLIEDPKVREALAQIAVENEVIKLLSWQTQWWFSEREKLGPQTYNIAGLLNKNFNTRRAKALMDIMGQHGQLKKGSKWVKYDGQIERTWQTMRSTHAGGTVEVYKIVLAQRGLGLPRPPRPTPKA